MFRLQLDYYSASGGIHQIPNWNNHRFNFNLRIGESLINELIGPR